MRCSSLYCLLFAPVNSRGFFSRVIVSLGLNLNSRCSTLIVIATDARPGCVATDARPGSANDAWYFATNAGNGFADGASTFHLACAWSVAMSVPSPARGATNAALQGVPSPATLKTTNVIVSVVKPIAGGATNARSRYAINAWDDSAILGNTTLFD